MTTRCAWPVPWWHNIVDDNNEGGTDVRASWCDDNDDKMTPMALCHDGTMSSTTMTMTEGMDVCASWCNEDAKDDDDNMDGQHHGSTW